MRSISALVEARLYGILDSAYTPEEQFVPMAEKLLAGGVGVLQIRAKDWSLEKIAAVASAVLPLCRKANVPLILNDYPELAAQVGANGVHVGQDDLPVASARELCRGIVGKSTHSIEQARAALEEKPDYIAFGPLFATATKPDYTPVGLSDIVEVAKLANQANIPFFCIGGIRLENLAEVLAAGAPRVVIVSALLKASDPTAYARKCLMKFANA